MPVKPSENEEKYFQELELKKRMEQQAQQDLQTTAAEKARLKELHWMHCPKCGHKLMIEKVGKVEVDVCPACKGIWLDVNELDEVIKNSAKTSILSSFLRVLGGK